MSLPLRDPHMQKLYDEYLQNMSDDFCAFCHKEESVIVSEANGIMVVQNRFPYIHWDKRPVLDHRMLIPTRHVATLSDLSDLERSELMHQMVEHEDRYYSLYLRAPKSKSRTITHIHLHCILLG